MWNIERKYVNENERKHYTNKDPEDIRMQI